MSLDSLLDARIIVCAGPGGVGKTTVSAAIALEGAARGAKTVVVTIDPAKRLADCLGVGTLSNQPTQVEPAQFRKAKLKPAPLHAMMLDTKTTFDDLVHRYARDEGRAARIIDNRFYQAIAGAFSGTHEYMAMEKLYELSLEDTYDLIVIDTPPTRQALDFLEAPKRLTSFLDGKLLKWFLLPAIGGGRGLFRAVNFAATSFLRLVTRVVGAEVLRDTADFFANFEGMYEGFKQRAQSVYELLRRDFTRFVVVTGPTGEAVDEAVFFTRRMRSYGLPFGALVVNRVHPRFAGSGSRATGAPLIDRMVSLANDFEQLRRREDESLERLEADVPQHLWTRVPVLSSAVADLSGLREVARAIFA